MSSFLLAPTLYLVKCFFISFGLSLIYRKNCWVFKLLPQNSFESHVYLLGSFFVPLVLVEGLVWFVLGWVGLIWVGLFFGVFFLVHFSLGTCFCSGITTKTTKSCQVCLHSVSDTQLVGRTGTKSSDKT